MLGFKLDFWDYATFGVLFLLVLSALVFLVWLAGLPGRGEPQIGLEKSKVSV